MAGLIRNLPREGFGWRGSWLLKIWNIVRAQPSCSSSFKKTVFKGLVLAFFFFFKHTFSHREGWGREEVYPGSAGEAPKRPANSCLGHLAITNGSCCV